MLYSILLALHTTLFFLIWLKKEKLNRWFLEPLKHGTFATWLYTPERRPVYSQELCSTGVFHWIFCRGFLLYAVTVVWNFFKKIYVLFISFEVKYLNVPKSSVYVPKMLWNTIGDSLSLCSNSLFCAYYVIVHAHFVILMHFNVYQPLVPVELNFPLKFLNCRHLLVVIIVIIKYIPATCFAIVISNISAIVLIQLEISNAWFVVFVRSIII